MKRKFQIVLGGIGVLLGLITLAIYAWLEDVPYGGFPSREEARDFPSVYASITSNDTKTKMLSLFLWRMRAPTTSEEDAIANETLRHLAEYYVSTRDENVLRVVEQVHSQAFGVYYDFVCNSFYGRLAEDKIYLERLRVDSKARKAFCHCVGITFSEADMDRMLATGTDMRDNLKR